MSNIVVTLGPSSMEPGVAERLVVAGANAFRFPASKLSIDELSRLAVEIASTAEKLGRPQDLLLDLPGAKSRFTNDIEFSLAGIPKIRVDFTPTPSDEHAAVPRLGLSGNDMGHFLEPGDVILIGDGEDALRVDEVHGDHCLTTPLTGGMLARRRGAVVSGKMPRFDDLTPSDAAALRLAPSTVFSAVILSFVESASIVEQARTLMRESGRDDLPAVVAKVETRAGALAVADIARSADAILLGRGDLLLEAGEVDFYALCRDVIKTAADLSCPVIVGTQLFDSLADSWLPHRSELAYISQLWEAGIDGLMLAYETTVGAQPVRTVEALSTLRSRYAPSPDGKPMFPTRLP
ncbi:pyruvate kinase [Micromonospora sp. NPDC093244]|uniref:pyruvate kinase n=1 Tax=Micromonospora sp. NPDC093244 TaxID=3155071 RepID=UPI00342A8059